MGFKFNPITSELDLVNPASGGDVVGPSSSTDNALVRYDGMTGKAIQSSGVILDDGDNMFFDTDKSLQFKVATNFIRYDSGEGKFLIATSADNAILKFTYGGASGYCQIDQFGFGEVARFSGGVFRLKAGESSSNAKVGGCIADFYSDVGNSTTTETDLYSYSVPANMLSFDGYKLKACYAGMFASSGTATRQLKCYFGGNNIFDSGALSISLSADWDVEVLVIRSSSGKVRTSVKLNTTGASSTVYANVQETSSINFGTSNILKITGTAAGIGAASNDIVAQIGTIDWTPAQ